MIYTFLLPDQSLISFDSVTEFGESLSASITSYEVEQGYPISDNMVLTNPSFSINGILSYYNSNEREVVLQDGVFVLVDGQAPIVTAVHIELETKVRNLMTMKIPFTIIKSESFLDVMSTEVERIPNCLLSDLSFQYTPTESGAVFPKMTIKQVRLAVVEETEMTNTTPALIPKARVADKQQVAQAQAEASTTDPTKKNTTTKESGNTDNGSGWAKDATLETRAKVSDVEAQRDAVIKATEKTASEKVGYVEYKNPTSKQWDVVQTGNK